MESLFRNCVSEFDLHFLDQNTNANEATQSVQCPVSRKHGIARMKDRLKGISQVVHKAKHTNQLLLENQQELLETKQELEETRNLLFEKNEEYKVICDERSGYFNQATEYLNEIQKLKEQLKQFKENDYELKLKDKIIQGYIDQVTGLQTEMINLTRDKKKSEKVTSLAVIQANKDKGVIEKKLVKLLSSYVCPTIKKRDKWLQSLIKKYLPNEKCDSIDYDLSEQTKTGGETFENVSMSPQHKEEENQKIQKPSAEIVINHLKQNETVSGDVGSPTSSMQHRNISLDFECVGSVDTGRGSSLAFSDGEKSFHSPDYYMNDSPLSTVANLCNKCNVVKADMCTSPIPLETSDIASSFTNTLCLSKSDSCTSPMLLKRLDVATETTDISYERDTPSKKLGARSISETLNNVSSKIYHTNSSQTSTFIGIDESTIEIDGEKISLNNIRKSSKESLTVPDKLNDKLTSSGCEAVNNINSITSSVESLFADLPVDFDAARVTTPNKLLINVISDSGEPLDEISRTSSPDDGFTMISPIDFDEVTTNLSSKELPTTSTDIRTDKTSDKKPNINRKILQEKECLKLNSSDNFGSDVGSDIEIQTILKKMRLQHELVTPIPKTPPQITTKSPSLTTDNLKAMVESNIQSVKPISDALCEDLNLIRAKLRDAFSPLVERMPMYVQQIMLLLTDSQPNERLLRNILSNSISSKNTHTAEEIESELLSHDINIESRCKTQPRAVNSQTSSTSTTKIKTVKIMNENKDSICNDYSKMQLDSENLKRIMNGKRSNVEIEEICDVLPYTKNCRISIVPEVEESCLVGYHNVEATNDKNTNNNSNGDVSHENVQKSIINKYMDTGDDTNQSTVVYLDTESMIGTNTRNNIVYESEGNVSDDDANMQQVLESGDVKQIPKTRKLNKNNENEQVCPNPSKNMSSRKARKMRKLTKLEKIRLKMAPKGKIRNTLKQPAKKLRFKPTPIIIPQSVHKKKVTESDSAASLNDKSVYENAVKIIAASKTRSNKEPRVIVEDCVLKIQNSPPKDAKSESNNKEDNNSNNPQLSTETLNKICNFKRKLVFDSEKVSDVPTELGEDSKKSVVSSKVKKRKRTTSTCSNDDVSDDTINLKQLQRKLNDMNSAKSEIIACQRRNSFSLNKSALETSSTKRNNEVVRNDVVKRKRTSISEYLSPCKKSNSNNNIVEVSIDNITSNEKDSCEAIITKRLSASTRQRTSIEADHTVLCPTVPKNTENIDKFITKSNQEIFESSLDSSVSSQRILRSSNVKQRKENGIERTLVQPLINNNTSFKMLHSKADQTQLELSESHPQQKNRDKIITYTDLSMFSNEDDCRQEHNKKIQEDDGVGYRDNLLCRMIEKHGVHKIRFCTKKVSDSKVNEISSKLERSISQIIELPHDQCLGAMKKLVIDIKSWDIKLFLVGLIKYLKNPQRKIELFKKLSCPPAPPMTSKEQVLLYVIDELQNHYEYRDIINKVLTNIEYVLFALNKTPEEMDVIESMSHFYALVCRSYQSISKLRLFIIDAMYCLQYKSIILIKQCLDVWMFALPLGHMGLAKTPLVACLVYLLHFYKCEDKFNRIQDIRNILRRKYNYDLTDWNETKILDLFKNAIAEMRDIPIEKKMLRLALIILAKRNGPTWCQNHIVKKMLQPMIKDKSTSEVAKQFCVSLLGPLLKPYPNNMKVHCEMITDYLLDMLGKKNSPKMQEAIITSLLCTNKQNDRVIQFLVKWNPSKVSPEFESMFRDYVRSKPVKKWKSILSSSSSST